MIMLYTRKQYNVTCQLYLDLKKESSKVQKRKWPEEEQHRKGLNQGKELC